MIQMFNAARAFNRAIGVWNTSKVTRMQSMFLNASLFNQDLSAWDVSSVTNMYRMFESATAMNSPWMGGVSRLVQATRMDRMFYQATSFNQPLNSWNVGNVTTFADMFSGAAAFNQDLNSWNTANVTDVSNMFLNATAFNGNITSWNTGKGHDLRELRAGCISVQQRHRCVEHNKRNNHGQHVQERNRVQSGSSLVGHGWCDDCLRNVHRCCAVHGQLQQDALLVGIRAGHRWRGERRWDGRCHGQRQFQCRCSEITRQGNPQLHVPSSSLVAGRSPTVDRRPKTFRPRQPT